MSYWSQWSSEEIAEMHGVEDDDTDLCHHEDDDTDLCQDGCPRCSGCGCNYCLMTGY